MSTSISKVFEVQKGAVFFCPPTHRSADYDTNHGEVSERLLTLRSTRRNTS